jgi:hypothetical protein
MGVAAAPPSPSSTCGSSGKLAWESFTHYKKLRYVGTHGAQEQNCISICVLSLLELTNIMYSCVINLSLYDRDTIVLLPSVGTLTASQQKALLDSILTRLSKDQRKGDSSALSRAL